MTEEKHSFWDGVKRYGAPVMFFVGGVLFDKYVLPRIPPKIFPKKENKSGERGGEKFYDQAIEIISDIKKYTKGKDAYSSLDEPLDALEHYFSDRKSHEQSK